MIPTHLDATQNEHEWERWYQLCWVSIEEWANFYRYLLVVAWPVSPSCKCCTEGKKTLLTESSKQAENFPGSRCSMKSSGSPTTTHIRRFHEVLIHSRNSKSSVGSNGDLKKLGVRNQQLEVAVSTSSFRGVTNRDRHNKCVTSFQHISIKISQSPL